MGLLHGHLAPGQRLPWALRVAEVHGHAGRDREPRVLFSFLAVIPCQRPAQTLGQFDDLRGERATTSAVWLLGNPMSMTKRL
jgi:hypothetical protein